MRDFRVSEVFADLASNDIVTDKLEQLEKNLDEVTCAVDEEIKDDQISDLADNWINLIKELILGYMISGESQDESASLTKSKLKKFREDELSEMMDFTYESFDQALTQLIDEAPEE